MKTTLRLALAVIICTQFICCAGMPVTLTFGASGKTDTGTDWHAGVSTPITYGPKQPVDVRARP